MKKRLMVMAMAGVALAGCVSDEVAEVAQKNQLEKIVFESPVLYDNAESRTITGEMGETYNKYESFKLFSRKYDATPGYTGWNNAEVAAFNGKPVSFDNQVDGWAPKKDDGTYYYWEPNQQLVFAACSPADELTSATYDANGLTISNFTVEDDPANQYDLLFSQRVYDAEASKMNHSSTYYSGIPFIFQHALSSIHFAIENETLAAENVTDRVEIRLMSIVLKGVKNVGTFKENLTDANSKDDPNKIYTRKDRNNGVGTADPKWTELSGSHDYVIFDADANNEDGLLFPEASSHVTTYLAFRENEQNKELGMANFVMLIPQAFTANEDACIEISYKADNRIGEQTRTIYLKECPITEWKIGYKYTYNLKYSLASAKLDKIIFSPSVEGWPDETIIDVEIK